MADRKKKDWRLFFEGDDYFAAVRKDMQRATRSIFVEVYIIQEDEIGTDFLTLFVEKARAGIQVRLLVDGVGSYNFTRSEATVAMLKEAGVELLIFRPVTPTFFLRISNHRRNHRKLVVIDGSVLYIGGMNFKRNHSKKVFGNKCWGDSMIRLTGRVAAEGEVAYNRMWKMVKANRLLLKHPHYLKRKLFDGFELIENTPFLGRMRNRFFFSRIIASAKKFVYIQTAYFIPNFFLLLQISRAARRGVDIRILLNRESDVNAAKWASHAFYHFLLKHGVRLYEYLPRFNHAKTLVVDGKIGILGSTNIDYRSFLHNLEIDVVTYREEVCREVVDRFRAVLKHSDEVFIEDWKKRPFHFKLLERFYYLFRYYL